MARRWRRWWQWWRRVDDAMMMMIMMRWWWCDDDDHVDSDMAEYCVVFHEVLVPFHPRFVYFLLLYELIVDWHGKWRRQCRTTTVTNDDAKRMIPTMLWHNDFRWRWRNCDVIFGKRIILVEERDHRTAVATTMAHSAAGTITMLLREQQQR